MTCTAKLYTESDYSIAFGTLTGFELGDVSDLSVTLTKGATTVTKTMSGGGVEIVGTTMFFTLTETDITEEGIYTLSIMLTDLAANTIRLTACPETLRFFN